MAEITQASGSGVEDPDRAEPNWSSGPRMKKSTLVDFGLRGARNPSGRPDPDFDQDHDLRDLNIGG